MKKVTMFPCPACGKESSAFVVESEKRVYCNSCDKFSTLPELGEYLLHKVEEDKEKLEKLQKDYNDYFE